MKDIMSRVASAAALSGALSVAAFSAAASAAEFGYYGDIGPDFWGELDPAWAACRDGTRQSPVDLGPQLVHAQLAIDYDEATEGEIFNNGHTIEVEISAGENSLRLDGRRYELLQFHFHTPSEHRVGGRGYDMELHLVHRSNTGRYAVIAVFLKRGDSSGALAPIFMQLPEIGGELNIREELDSPFDPGDFLPQRTHHYRYPGSLTTPACTEGVKWVVMRDPVTLLDEDMAQFAARIGFNARYTQRSVPDRR